MSSGRRGARWRVIACALAAAWFTAADVHASGDASAIEGRLHVSLPGAAIADLGPIVVYLEPAEGVAPPPSTRENVVIHQKNARFSPPFRVVAAGQSVQMVNDDWIYHNVFSYSRPNDFDLGVYPSGQSRTVTLAHPGVVKTYCSIHESMNGTIFVAPTAWYTVASESGEFAIVDVPPGRYRLAVWCEKLPVATRDVDLLPGTPLRIEVDLTAGS